MILVKQNTFVTGPWVKYDLENTALHIQSDDDTQHST